MMTTVMKKVGCGLLAGLFACNQIKPPVGKSKTLAATTLKPIGRTVLRNDKLVLISSGAHFGVGFEGKTCKVYLSLRKKTIYNYIQYSLDGVYGGKIKINGSVLEPLVITANNEGYHRLWLYKATEPYSGEIMVIKIDADNVAALPVTPMPVIEFIGNSITCGAQADASVIPCDSGAYHDRHNAYFAYGPRLARALNTNFILSSISGIGMYRNWNSDGPTMPDVYDYSNFENGKLDILKPDRFWDFSKTTPAIVSINLGTNDLSPGDGVTARLPFDTARFTTAYITFVKKIKSKYPLARLVLINSPVVDSVNDLLLTNCLQQVKIRVDSAYPNDKPIAMFHCKQMAVNGCAGHPSVSDHEKIAAELTPFFKSLLNE